MTDLPASAPAAPVQLVTVAAAPTKPNWRDWIPVISLMIIVMGLIWAGGKYVAELEDDTRRIEAIEKDAQTRAAQLEDIKERSARIETKLDMLVSSKMGK